MPTGRTCGNCVFFVRINGFGNGRNGICGRYDYNCHSDSPYAKRCEGYKAKKFKRTSKNPPV